MGFRGYKTISITLFCSLLGMALLYPHHNTMVRTPSAQPPESESPHVPQLHSKPLLSATGIQKISNTPLIKDSLKFSGDSLSIENQGWKIISNLIAFPVLENEKPNPNALYRIHQHDFFSTSNSLEEKQGYLIAFNPDRERFGIISGTLVISFHQKNELSEFVSNHSLRVDEFVENINTIFVSTSSPFELNLLHASLIQDKRIKTLDVEIIENRMVKQ